MGIELGIKISALRKRQRRSNLVIRSKSIRTLRRRLMGIIDDPDKKKNFDEEEGQNLVRR